MSDILSCQFGMGAQARKDDLPYRYLLIFNPCVLVPLFCNTCNSYAFPHLITNVWYSYAKNHRRALLRRGGEEILNFAGMFAYSSTIRLLDKLRVSMLL